jgi:hypothetical protein
VAIAEVNGIKIAYDTRGPAGARKQGRHVCSGRTWSTRPMLMADKVSGLYCRYAVMAALFHRQRTGEGQHVEMPML